MRVPELGATPDTDAELIVIAGWGVSGRRPRFASERAVALGMTRRANRPGGHRSPARHEWVRCPSQGTTSCAGIEGLITSNQ
jgi:hypothetical protein